ncbi:unnamed protein product [Blepharisma stoltei]|uniref:Protein kinase domain-containing protein n=1 Tax=Blepharisma stoltei TaxID=1481888 RepID=A0AAU9JVG8_9CILI|nr:unnamed protein product [Blepharisma stoltei]
MSINPTIDIAEISSRKSALNATTAYDASHINLNQVYKLEDSLMYSDDCHEICVALNRHLIDLYKNEGLQYSLIPFGSIKLKKTGPIAFEFEIVSSAIPVKDDLITYQEFINNSLSLYLFNLVKVSRKPLVKNFKIGQDVQFVDSGRTFKAKKVSKKYMTMIVATMVDNTMVFIKPIINRYKVDGLPYECFIFCHLQHPHIIKCYGYTKYKSHKCLVFQHISTVLDSYIRNNNLSIQKCLSLIIEIGQGLFFMHIKHVAAMNISPWSIFINSNYKPIIADLENAVCLDLMPNQVLCYKEEDYAAPEALEGIIDYKCDVYSYGLVSFFILTKQNYMETHNLENLPENIRMVIEMMLSEDPNERPSIKTCCQEFENIYKQINN